MPEYDWISVWIEFLLPGLQVKFKTQFTVYELGQLKDEITTLYKRVLSVRETPAVKFDALENTISLSFQKISPGYVAVNLVLRPENSAESIRVSDTFYLDQSYFPGVLAGLDEMINWPL